MREQKFIECLKVMQSHYSHIEETDKLVEGLTILQKLINNILNNPREEKFRIIKKSNNAIKTKLLSLVPEDRLLEMLEVLGYVENKEEDTFVFVGDYLTLLKRGYAEMENVLR